MNKLIAAGTLFAFLGSLLAPQSALALRPELSKDVASAIGLEMNKTANSAGDSVLMAFNDLIGGDPAKPLAERLRLEDTETAQNLIDSAVSAICALAKEKRIAITSKAAALKFINENFGMVNIIVASGEGTRLGADVPKQILKADGISAILKQAREGSHIFNSEDIVVISPEIAEQYGDSLKYLLGENAIIAIAPSTGPGGAFKAGVEKLMELGKRPKFIMPVYSDYPTLTLDKFPRICVATWLKAVANSKSGVKITVAAKEEPKGPEGRGVIFTDDKGRITKIKEWKEIPGREQRKLMNQYKRAIKTGKGYPLVVALAFVFNFDWLTHNLDAWFSNPLYDHLDPEKGKQHEYYYLDLVEMAHNQSREYTDAISFGTNAPTGIKNPERLQKYREERNAMIVKLLRNIGVKADDKASVTVSSPAADLDLERDLLEMFGLDSGSVIKGTAHLEKGCRIGTGVTLDGTTTPVTLNKGDVVKDNAIVIGKSIGDPNTAALVNLFEEKGILHTSGKDINVLERELLNILYPVPMDVAVPQEISALFPQGIIAGAFVQGDLLGTPDWDVMKEWRINKVTYNELLELGKCEAVKANIKEEGEINVFAIDFADREIKRVKPFIVNLLDAELVSTDKPLQYNFTNNQINEAIRRVIKTVILGDPDAVTYNPRELTDKIANEMAIDIETERVVKPGLKARCIEAIGSGIVDFNNPELRRELEEKGLRFISAQFNAMKDAGLVIDFWDEYENEVIDAKLPVSEVYLPDNNGEIIFDLLFIQGQLQANPNLIIHLIPKDGQFADDASWQDVASILDEDKGKSQDKQIFKNLNSLIGSRFFVERCGPKIQGIDGSRMSSELAKILLNSDVVFAKGQANFEMLRGLNKPVYYGFIVKGATTQTITGIKSGLDKFVLLRVNPGDLAFDNYRAKTQRRSVGFFEIAGFTALEYATGRLSEENIKNILTDIDGYIKFVKETRSKEKYDIVSIGGGSCVFVNGCAAAFLGLRLGSIACSSDNGGLDAEMNRSLFPIFGHTIPCGDVTNAFKGLLGYWESLIYDTRGWRLTDEMFNGAYIFTPEEKQDFQNEMEILQTFEARAKKVAETYKSKMRELNINFTPSFMNFEKEIINLARLVDKNNVLITGQKGSGLNIEETSIRHSTFYALMIELSAYNNRRKTIDKDRFRIGLYLLEKALGIHGRITVPSLDYQELFAEWHRPDGGVAWTSDERGDEAQRLRPQLAKGGQVAVSLAPDEKTAETQLKVFRLHPDIKEGEKIQAHEEALEILSQVREGGIVTIGPSSFVVSIGPSMVLLKDKLKSLKGKASRVLILNNDYNTETNTFKEKGIRGFIEFLEMITGGPISDVVDYILVNTEYGDTFPELKEALRDKGDTVGTYKERGQVIVSDEEMRDIEKEKGIMVINMRLVRLTYKARRTNTHSLSLEIRPWAIHDAEKIADIYSQLLKPEKRPTATSGAIGGNTISASNATGEERLIELLGQPQSVIANRAEIDTLVKRLYRPRPVRPVIIGAGKGTRYEDSLPEGVNSHNKCLAEVNGIPVVKLVVDNILSLKGKDVKLLRPVVIVSKDNEAAIKEALKGYNVHYILQNPVTGTGHSALQLRNRKKFARFDGDFLFIYATMAVVQPKTLEDAVKIQQSIEGCKMVYPAAWHKNPYAPLRTEGARVLDSEETHLEGVLPPEYGLDNVGAYVVDAKTMFKALGAYDQQYEKGSYKKLPNGELGLPNTLGHDLPKAEKLVIAAPIADPRECHGIKKYEDTKTAENYRFELLVADDIKTVDVSYTGNINAEEPSYIIHVKSKTGEVLSMLSVKGWSHFKDNVRLHVDQIATTPDIRRAGMASLLMRTNERIAREIIGAKAISLKAKPFDSEDFFTPNEAEEVKQKGDILKSFYEKNGYHLEDGQNWPVWNPVRKDGWSHYNGYYEGEWPVMVKILSEEAALIIGPKDNAQAEIVAKLQASGIYKEVLEADNEAEARELLAERGDNDSLISVVIDTTETEVDLAIKITEGIRDIKVKALKTREPSVIEEYLKQQA